MREEEACTGILDLIFLKRECLPSLYVSARSDRRQSSGQEEELLYAERVSRGY